MTTSRRVIVCTGISICAALLILALPQHASGQERDIHTESSWIWFPENVSTDGLGSPCYLRRTVTLADSPEQARLRFRADDSCTFTVNGTRPQKALANGPGGAVYDL